MSVFREDYECRCDVNVCLCGPDERALRAIIGSNGTMKMTDQQRKWCLDEIDQVEGYNVRDYHGLADEHLARGVLSAWTDYCRDKGLL